MIDIHCHILPDIDDGATCLDEALEMARMAVRSGVTEIVTTPHFYGELGQAEYRQLMNQRFTQLDEAIRQAGIPLKLHPGAEILCLPETAELASLRRLPTLGKTDYVLTEFYFDESFAYMDECLADVVAGGYRPVVAHPERYGVIQRDPLLLTRWARLGYVLQLNKGSVLGAFGSLVEQTANAILELGIAHLFASDAHSSLSRTPHMGGLIQWTEEYCDPDYAAILLEENPSLLLRGKSIMGDPTEFMPL